jgi:hypothetical protein
LAVVPEFECWARAGSAAPIKASASRLPGMAEIFISKTIDGLGPQRLPPR